MWHVEIEKVELVWLHAPQLSPLSINISIDRNMWPVEMRHDAMVQGGKRIQIYKSLIHCKRLGNSTEYYYDTTL